MLTSLPIYRLTILMGFLGIAGCSHSQNTPENSGEFPQPPEPPQGPDAQGPGVDCEAPAPTGSAEGWRRVTSRALVRLGDPVHAVVDAIALPGERTVIEGKFTYGPTSADLENEPVRAYVRDASCTWIELGEMRTDSDGRARFEVDTASLGGPGEYPVRFIVAGDASLADGAIHILDRDRPVVIFDIDGTLTTSDVELVDGIILHHVGSSSDELLDLAGSPLTRAQWLRILEEVLDEEAEIHPGAVDVVSWYADLGVQPVYITGRPYLYDGLTRRWLENHGLPAGPLVMVQDVLDSLPENVGAYKADHLIDLQTRGLTIRAAYGNATTDVCAYSDAGIAAEDTYIVGPHAGTGCEGSAPTQAIEGYPEHLTTLSR